MRIIHLVPLMLIMTNPLPAQDPHTTTQIPGESALNGIVQTLQKSVSKTLGGRQFWSDVRFFRADAYAGTSRCLQDDRKVRDDRKAVADQHRHDTVEGAFRILSLI